MEKTLKIKSFKINYKFGIVLKFCERNFNKIFFFNLRLCRK